MDSINFQLQFDPKRITELAERFSYEKTELEESITTVIKMNVSQKQYLTLDELKVVAEWKTERSKSRVAKNEKEDVEECTKIRVCLKNAF